MQRVSKLLNQLNDKKTDKAIRPQNVASFKGKVECFASVDIFLQLTRL